MTPDTTESALLQRLSAADSQLSARLTDLRSTVAGWLAYVPATFPHYTRHTIEHSDEIVRQLSGLLFVNADPDQPVSPLSSMELYVLGAAAYLHDAGMVTSDADKERLLASPEWIEWTVDGPAARQWQAIAELRLRADRDSPDASQLHFAADLQTRFLIGEYIRRNHHLRVDDLLRDHPALRATADMGDASLGKTIIDVCIAHGLSTTELAVDERYPNRRDIQGQPVDVRFMSILLRFGDLLDLSHDRACPLLLNAASPLPPGSVAHWKQYDRIVHRVTSPDRIELRAECETQSEHRLLRDWCQWIVDEAWDAQVLQRGSDRHRDWRPPLARLEAPDATLVVVPSPAARYVPVDWRIESDPATVLGRFANDIYSDDLAFLKELLQNAFDASRCRVHAMQGGTSQMDGWWTPEALRVCHEYPVDITLTEVTTTNEVTGIADTRQVVAVADRGLGMGVDVIQRYLLQAGQSFYNSPSFRQQYGFVSASRFGVGFLSVFGVSDHVVVSTKAYGDSDEDGIRLDLRGPRNYVLVESDDRQAVGTTVEVELRDQIEPHSLLKAIKQWCARVEFPVRVSVNGETTLIEAEDPGDFESRIDVDTAGVAAFQVRSIPLQSSIARGEIYVLERVKQNGGVEWDVSPWNVAEWVKAHAPMLPDIPRGPHGLLALHGISNDGNVSRTEMALRVDVRASQDERRLNMARENRPALPPEDLGLDEAIEQVVTDHFEDVGRDRQYKADVLRTLDVPWRISAKIPDLVEVWRPGEGGRDAHPEVLSWGVLADEPEVAFAFGSDEESSPLAARHVNTLIDSGCLVVREEVRFSLYGEVGQGLTIRPSSFRWSDDKGWLAVQCSSEAAILPANGAVIVRTGDDFETDELLLILSLRGIGVDTAFLNMDHPIAKRLASAAERSLEAGECIRLQSPQHRFWKMDALDLLLCEIVHFVSYGYRYDRGGKEELNALSAPYLSAAFEADEIAEIDVQEPCPGIFKVIDVGAEEEAG